MSKKYLSRSIFGVLGAFALFSLLPTSVGATSLSVVSGSAHVLLNWGGGTVTYNLNAAPGGQMTFNNGNSNVATTWALGASGGFGNISIAQASPGTPQHLLNVANPNPGVGAAFNFTFQGAVGSQHSWHINDIVAQYSNLYNQGLPGASIGQVFDLALSGPNAAPNTPPGYTGFHVNFTDQYGNGHGSILIPQSQFCGGQVGCVGNMDSINSPVYDANNPTNAYMGITYAGFSTILNSNLNRYETWQLFNVAGQGALVSNGQTVAHMSLMPGFKIGYMSGFSTIGGGPNGGGSNGGGPSTAVPEPATLGLLTGALGLGAIRRKRKN